MPLMEDEEPPMPLRDPVLWLREEERRVLRLLLRLCRLPDIPLPDILLPDMPLDMPLRPDPMLEPDWASETPPVPSSTPAASIAAIVVAFIIVISPCRPHHSRQHC